MQFSQRLSILIEEKGITAYRLRKDLKLSNSIVTYWMDGTRLPNGESLIKLANYFDVSIDYLVGRIDNTHAVAAEPSKAHSEDVMSAGEGEFLSAALSGNLNLTEKQKESVVEYIRFIRQERKDD